MLEDIQDLRDFSFDCSANERNVLTLIRRDGPQSKADLTRATGLSAQSASRIVRRLHNLKLLAPRGSVRGKIGQPSTPFDINEDGAYSIGVKIGRRTADVVTTNFAYKPLKSTVLTYDYPAFEELRLNLVSTIRAHLEEMPPQKKSRVCGFGLAAPNGLESWEASIGAPPGAMSDWANRDMATELSNALGKSFHVLNDASAACLAELNSGNHARAASYIYFYVGTFVGGGIVSEGHLFSGENGNAAAIGSLPFTLQSTNRFGQLIEQASVIGLTDQLIAHGLPYQHAFERVDLSVRAEEIVKNWLLNAGQALAFAALSGQAFLDIHEIVIDGSLNQDLRKRLVEEARLALRVFDRRGLSEICIREGSVGFNARAQGAAILPFQHEFEI